MLNNSAEAKGPRENQVLARLPEEAYLRLHPFLQPVSWQPGETIYRAGDTQTHAYFPGTGIAGYFLQNENGQCTQVSMVGRDSLIGLSQGLAQPQAQGEFVTMIPGRAWKLPARVLQQELLSDGPLMSEFLGLLQFEFDRVGQLSFCHQHHTVLQQFSSWLLMCLDQLDGAQIDTTQELMARMLCVRRQSVSEAITKLQGQGLIQHNRGQITVLDHTGLEATACECRHHIRRNGQALRAPTQKPLVPSAPLTRQVANHLAQRVTLLEQALTASRISWWDVDLVSGVNEQTGCDLWCHMLGHEPGHFNPTVRQWDALVHPDDQATREAARQAHLDGLTPLYEAEYRILHKDGHWVWIHARGQVTARDAHGKPLRMVGTNEDITARKQAELALEKLTRTDHLTQAANRLHFFEVGQREFARAQRYGSALTLLYLDLDQFKRINDLHGHTTGDRVLQNFADTVRSLLRVSDVFARLGGEEFALLLPHTDENGAAVMAQRILDSVREQTIGSDSDPVHYSVSLGLASAQPGTSSFEHLLKAADQALYQAKEQGRNRLAIAP